MPKVIYDDGVFFEKYSRMERSVHGLSGAGEWHALRPLLPDLAGKRVLDLGCGFGWHCRYAVEQGAASAVGVDLSERMLARAEELTDSPRITYRRGAIEEVDFPVGSFDLVFSSLALHYVADFGAVCDRVKALLAPGGSFAFSVEHPVFTAEGRQDWCYREDGSIRHWPVDNYYLEGPREAVFLGEQMVKYHRTLTTYVQSLLTRGFVLDALVEAAPDPAMLHLPGMQDELRRPMMLLIAAHPA